MSRTPLQVVVLGLSLSSSWGNGHATTFRALLGALNDRGHRVTFLERDVPWYAQHRDMPQPSFATTHLYRDLEELEREHRAVVQTADLVIVGSYVPEGVRVGQWAIEATDGVCAFYDIDTPVTLAALDRGELEYLDRDLVTRYDLYLSFTGGPTLRELQRRYGAPQARALYCAVDPMSYYPEPATSERWRMGYLGTYSDDRQPRVETLLNAPARRLSETAFVVAGPQYPESIAWSDNVERIEHIPPPEHRYFYNAQRFTLNVTRDDMIARGWSPSVRLFEAAACATPIISDIWDGLEQLFEPGREILLARDTEDALRHLRDVGPQQARAIGMRARERVLAEHTAAHRAIELEQHWMESRRT